MRPYLGSVNESECDRCDKFTIFVQLGENNRLVFCFFFGGDWEVADNKTLFK